MSNRTAPDPFAQRDGRTLEETQIHRTVRVNDDPKPHLPAHLATTRTRHAYTVPTYAHAPTTTTVRPPTGGNKAYRALTKKEEELLRFAHEQEGERDWLAHMQQRRTEKAFRGTKEMAVLQTEMAREIVKELKDALRLALEEEEEGYKSEVERLFREQKIRGAELRANEEAVRVKREKEAKKFWEHEEAAIERTARELRELEEAAVRLALKESMVSEEKRKLAEQEEKEKKRVESFQKEAEMKAKEERLKRHVDWKKGQGGARSERTAAVGEDAGVPLSARGRGRAPAFVEDELPCPPYSLMAGSHSNTYGGGNQELLGFFPEPTWGRPTPPLANNSPRRSTFESDAQDCVCRDRRLDLGWSDETEPMLWRHPGLHARRWRETKIERWETLVRHEEEYHDTFQVYKEVTETTRRRL